MKTAEEIILSKEVEYFDWLRMKGTTPSVYNAIIEAVNEARIEAIKECIEELQVLRNNYEVIESNLVVSIYSIDHLIENFEKKINKIT